MGSGNKLQTQKKSPWSLGEGGKETGLGKEVGKGGGWVWSIVRAALGPLS